jgi:3-hydroxyisobutyrate dehydrogenase-like beta-hydroxyacid dehydrogenase
MGSAIGAALRAGGARVVATAEGRSERTRRLAAEGGVEVLPTLADVVAAADVVLSVAPPDQAPAIADTLAALPGPRPLVADLNAVSPATARGLAARLEAAGYAFVDGSISGPPPRRPGTTRIYLSGHRAAEVAALPLQGVDLRVVGGEAGTASAVKMCTASVYKGTVGLLLQALLTAHANGVVEHVVDDLREAFPELVDGAAATLARAGSKSERFVGEMREIADTQAAAGLPRELFDGYAAVYEALAATPAAARAPEQVDASAPLADVLAELRAGYTDPPERP